MWDLTRGGRWQRGNPEDWKLKEDLEEGLPVWGTASAKAWGPECQCLGTGAAAPHLIQASASASPHLRPDVHHVSNSSLCVACFPMAYSVFMTWLESLYSLAYFFLQKTPLHVDITNCSVFLFICHPGQHVNSVSSGALCVCVCVCVCVWAAPYGMCDLSPWLGIDPAPLALAGRALITGPPEKSPGTFLCLLLCFKCLKQCLSHSRCSVNV